MPVIVVGADTREGRAIVAGLLAPGREVRAFASDPGAAAEMRRSGVKVALGDVSDEGHVQSASTGCFTAVLITEAARDGRERSFASSEAQLLEAWSAAVGSAGVNRVIWVGDEPALPVATKEVATVSPSDPDLVAKVVTLDNVDRLA